MVALAKPPARPDAPNATYEINLPNATKIYGLEGEAQANFGQFSFTANAGLLKSELGTFWSVDPGLDEPLDLVVLGLAHHRSEHRVS